jgi:CRISPR-associated protein Csx10
VKYFSLELTTLSPVAIRADHAPSGVASIPYITGTTLAGSLAAAYRSYYDERSSDFERLFLSGQVQFPHLYPATIKDKSVRESMPEWERTSKLAFSSVYPLPRTALSCKRFSGFSLTADDSERHGVHDTLFDWAIFQRGSQSFQALKALQEHKNCKKCGKATHQFSGFYRHVSSPRGRFTVQTGAGTRLQTHTGIDRATGTVQEGMLYSRQVFDENSRFQGVVKLPDDDELARSFTNFIGQMKGLGLIRIGTGRTRGMGKVELTIEPLEEKPFGYGLFTERLENFNQTMQKALEDAKIQVDSAPFYFALTLHSPAILRDSLLRYRGSINAEALADLLGTAQFTQEHFERIYQTASVQRITGWNDLWGTPRFQEIVIESGSVFLFAFKGEMASKGLYEALFRLEREGIGERTAEGFGRVYISDPFHREEGLR